MKTIEFTHAFEVAGKPVTSVEVRPMGFVELVKVWRAASVMAGNEATALRRARIKAQTVFKAGNDTLLPTDADMQRLPRGVASSIIAALDAENGPSGDIVLSGDGITTPILYKLGTPFAMSNGKDDASITELEFMASTYGEVEDVMAADSELAKAELLIRTVAVPVGSPLTRLPQWAMDKLTLSDGLQIMNLVNHSF